MTILVPCISFSFQLAANVDYLKRIGYLFQLHVKGNPLSLRVHRGAATGGHDGFKGEGENSKAYRFHNNFFRPIDLKPSLVPAVPG